MTREKINKVPHRELSFIMEGMVRGLTGPNLIVVAFDSFGTVIATSNESASRLK